jgi:pimeloyl-ACP methyl ester carboxylesterase
LKAALLVILSLAPLAAQAQPQPLRLQVGSLTLEHCQTPAAWCGRLSRPLDPAGALKDSISIYFEYYPHSAPGPSEGTLVAAEGGPGYSTTESREDYLALYEPLRARRDVLLMDLRGTGRSGALNCERLQKAPALTEELMGECGRFLGPKAALYSTAFAADDLAALLAALGLGKVDLYGDSYGSFFAQVFAVRHPEKLRSLVLDGADAVEAGDFGWYPNYPPATREKFNLVCQRSPDCSRQPGTSVDRIRTALEKLRMSPIDASAPDGDGRPQHFKADGAALATVMYGSAPRYASVRELDAAARAFMQDDAAPLLRLMAESRVNTDSLEADPAPQAYSAALAAAVSCQDEPQIYDMSLPPESRVLERDRIVVQREHQAPDTYAPFSFAEYRGMPVDYAFIDQCVRWPVAPRAHPAGEVLKPARYPDVPVLVISGDLDNLTPIADAELVVRHYRHAFHLILRNSFHVNALPRARSGCAVGIARTFLESLKIPNTDCRETVPPVRVAPLFARFVRQVDAAQPASGNATDREALRTVAAAVLTAADVIDQLESNTTGKGVGLRGGTFQVTAAAGTDRIELHDIRWTDDLAVSGTIVRPAREGWVTAELLLDGPGASRGKLSARWQGMGETQAEVHGDLDGHRVVASMAAP